MGLARSVWGKAVVTAAALIGFIWLYDVTIPDSRFALLPLGFERAIDPTAPPVPGARVPFAATAYCKGLVTSSGVAVQKGVMAADPSLLPIGTVIELSVEDARYDGIYTILDTGPQIQGREVDIYMWSCYEALRFGRKAAHIRVLRLGWNPRNTSPSLIDRIFQRPERVEQDPLPSRPLPIEQGSKN